ncbi:unnamed protein product [Polarella glacialis]|uniref:Methyltransferase FkbM domain-containing protein n=2 Tax=Polarella glacialis TaxID=89957 RepID=A0A813DJ34_POLGL|nr:unnamed protein product [Polarella glacialis]
MVVSQPQRLLCSRAMLPLDKWLIVALLWAPFASIADEASCAQHLLTANVFEDAKDPAKLGIYADCVMLLRYSLTAPKAVHVAGVHYPTLIVSRHSEPGLVYESFRDGEEVPHTFVLPAFDLNIGHAMKLVGTHNIRQSYEMQLLLRPGDSFVDCGANLGAYVVPMAERLGRSGRVLAFEPFLHTFQHLTANVALNGLLNVQTVQAALGNSTLRRTLSAPRMDYFNTLGAMRVEGQMNADVAIDSGITYEGEEEVQVYALDDFLESTGKKLPSLRLIKIDVEGMETQVVQGARRTIAAHLPIIWSENTAYFERQDTGFLAVMHELGYGCGKSESAPQDLICTAANGRGHQTEM